MVERVKTPTKSPPDYHDPKTFAKVFEEKNIDLGLFFTQETMDGFYELLEDIEIIWGRQEGERLFDTFSWSVKVDEIEKLIEKVKNPYTKRSLTEKYVQLVAGARKTPVQRAHSFGVFQELLEELAAKCVDADTRIREEMAMNLRDDFEVPSDDLTEEEIEALFA